MKIIHENWRGDKKEISIEEAVDCKIEGYTYGQGEIEYMKQHISNQTVMLGKIVAHICNNQNETLLKELLGSGYEIKDKK